MNITCEKVSKKFGSVVALEEVDLSVSDGEIRALLGGNGSGKSTLVKILAGVVAPSSGNITVYGRPYTIRDPQDAKKAGVIMTSQELSLLDNLTVAENISLCTIPSKCGIADQKQMRKTAEEVLGLLGMSHLTNAFVGSLAPNEKYMVEYAKALAQKPKILLVDEITSALFKEDVAKIKASLHQLKAEGCSIIFISHRMGEILDICDSVTVMRNGRTVASMPVADCEEHTLLRLMTGREFGENAADHSQDEKHVHETVLSISGMHLPGFAHAIDLDVAEGEIVGIAGLQGHGQSEFVRKLFGMNKAVHITFHGKKIEYRTPQEAIRHGIAFISGDREKEGVFREQSIAENLNVVRRIVLRREANDTRKTLDGYGVVYDNPRQRLVQLSGGNQQKVVIGRWMSIEPKMLLADDPTKGIDVSARSDVHRMMTDLSAKGSVILMFSSDDTELVSLTKNAPLSSVIVMYEGEIVKRLRGADITEENISKASLQVTREEAAK